MSFSFPFSIKDEDKKKREEGCNPLLSSTSLSIREHTYPTLASIVQAKTSPNPSPSSSTSSRSRPGSVSLTSPPLPIEESENNIFYNYIQSRFNAVFARSTVVCIPHSRSLEGIVLTKDFIESHCYNASPYYRSKYQAANEKEILIEPPLISTVSRFKEQRTVYILSEEPVYIGQKKIRVLLIDRPLEGEASQHQKSGNTINIPTCRYSKSDFDFLNMFNENTEPLVELQSAVQEFVDTYVYIRGFNIYTVEKLQHIYTKAYKTILQRNKLIRDACRIQAEHDHFLELVENVVMGFIHHKIWVQSLRSILQSQDAYLYSICQSYAKDNVTLQSYAVRYPISEMPLFCFEDAIACLRRVDADADIPLHNNYRSHSNHSNHSNHNDNNNKVNNTNNNTNNTNRLAFTPLEKVTCVKLTLDAITKAVDDYAMKVRNGSGGTYQESLVTTDQLIPLLAYVITHSHIPRIASLAFYIENFRLSHMERSEHEFALASLKTAIGFLEGDPLSLLDASSTVSNVSTSSSSSTALSPQLQNLRTRSTSFGSPSITSPTFSTPHSTPSYNHYSPSSSTHRPSSYHSPQVSKAALASCVRPSSVRGLRHQKSQSADLQRLLDDSSSSDTNGKDEDEHQEHSLRGSLTPKIRSSTAFQTPIENRKSLDIPNDWLIHSHDVSKSSPNILTSPFDVPQQQPQNNQSEQQQHRHFRQPHQSQYNASHLHQPHSPPTQLQHQHHHINHHYHHQQPQPQSHYINYHGKPSTPPKHVLGHTQPMISTTLPTLSNSTPLPGNSPPSSTSVNQQYYYYRHQQYQRYPPASPKRKEMALLHHCTTDNRSHNDNHHNNNNNDGHEIGRPSSSLSGTATPTLSPKPASSPSHTSYFDPAASLDYSSLDDLDANNRLGRSLSTCTLKQHPALHHKKAASSRKPSSYVLQPPEVININDRLSFDSVGRRPASICIDTRSSLHGRSTDASSSNEEDMGDFLTGLRKMDGYVVGEYKVV